jgi:hypothetical protein
MGSRNGAVPDELPENLVRKAVETELEGFPADLRASATAAAALRLADSIDLGPISFRFQAGLVSELRECMTELRAKAPAKVEGDKVDDLLARRARRRAAPAG